MPTTIEDRLVVGDVSVMADLYRQHGAFIHTISRELVGAAADRLTQQVFTEAWRDRLDFNPSLGTVRNWLIRRARDRVSKTSAEADTAVDRLVVAASLARMEDLRRHVVLAGFEASDADALATQLDQPVATIRGNLRRGSDQLKADLAESRTDGDDGGLADIMEQGPPQLELVPPPEVVWQAIAAELDLDTGAVTTDDFARPDEEPVTDGTDAGSDPHDELSSESNGASDVAVGSGENENAAGVDQLDPDEPASGAGILEIADGAEGASGSREHNGGGKSVDRLQSLADAAEPDQRGWLHPTIVAVAVVVLIIVILALL